MKNKIKLIEKGLPLEVINKGAYDENRKQREATESITKFENRKLKKNLHKISSSPNNNIPLWKTINSPSPKIRYEINRL